MEGPSPEQEIKHLAEQCSTLLRENERLRAMVEDACKVFDHYDLPEHAFHYRRDLNRVHEQGAGK